MSIMALRVTLTGAVSASDVEKYLILGLQKGAVLCSGGKLGFYGGEIIFLFPW